MNNYWTYVLGLALIPVVIFAILGLKGQLKARAWIHVFSRTPFSRLDDIGLLKTSSSKGFLWEFKKQKIEGVFDGYFVKCDVRNCSSRYITFFAAAKNLPFSSIEYYAIENYLSQQNIRSFRKGFLKVFRVDDEAISSIDSLEKELMKFTYLLRDLGLKPITSGGLMNASNAS